MATIKAFIRTTSKKETAVRFRVSDGRDVQLFYVSGLMVLPALWDNVSDGFLRYVPKKTSGESGRAATVPQLPKAAEIINRYKGGTDKRLIPFTNLIKYNVYI